MDLQKNLKLNLNKHRMKNRKDSSPKRLFFALVLGMLLMTPGWALAQEVHHLIAGSFKDFETAGEMVTSLKMKGYSPLVIFPDATTKKYRVSVYNSLSRTEVDAFAESLKAKDRSTKSYWIYSQQDPTAMATRGQDDSSNKRKAKKGKVKLDHEAPVYHLIKSSMNSFEAAQESVDALSAKGYEPYIIFPSAAQTGYRVSVYASNDRDEVQAYSNLLKKKGEAAGWIYQEMPGTDVTSTLGVATSSTARMPSASGKTYHLIGGSFKNFDQASEYANDMKAKGYDPLIMFPELGKFDTFRVSVYRSTNRSEVNSYNQSMKSKGDKGGWVFEN